MLPKTNLTNGMKNIILPVIALVFYFCLVSMIEAYLIQCVDWGIVVTMTGDIASCKHGQPREKSSLHGKEPYLHHSLIDFNFYYSFSGGK